VRRAPVCANEDGGAHGLHAEGLGDRLGGAEIGEQRRAALLEEARGHWLRDERGVDLARVDRAEETTPPQAHEMELGDADADASQQPAEPGELGSARCRHGDAEPPEALDGPYRARMPGGDEPPGPPRDRLRARLLRLYAALERRFGPQRWWPGRTPYEVAVGAVLTQHTAWTNAARAVAALRAQRLLRPRRLAARGEAEVARAIRAAGTPRVKARRLRALTRWLLDRFGGAFAPLRRLPLAPLRRELL